MCMSACVQCVRCLSYSFQSPSEVVPNSFLDHAQILSKQPGGLDRPGPWMLKADFLGRSRRGASWVAEGLGAVPRDARGLSPYPGSLRTLYSFVGSWSHPSWHPCGKVWPIPRWHRKGCRGRRPLPPKGRPLASGTSENVEGTFAKLEDLEQIRTDLFVGPVEGI